MVFGEVDIGLCKRQVQGIKTKIPSKGDFRKSCLIELVET